MFAEIFIRRPKFAFVLSLVTVLVGTLCLFRLPIAEYPEIAPERDGMEFLGLRDSEGPFCGPKGRGSSGQYRHAPTSIRLEPMRPSPPTERMATSVTGSSSGW